MFLFVFDLIICTFNDNNNNNNNYNNVLGDVLQCEQQVVLFPLSLLKHTQSSSSEGLLLCVSVCRSWTLAGMWVK